MTNISLRLHGRYLRFGILSHALTRDSSRGEILRLQINSGGQEDAVDDEGGDKYRNGNVEILGSQQRGDSGFHIRSTLLCLVFFIEAGNLFFHAKVADTLKTRHRTP